MAKKKRTKIKKAKAIASAQLTRLKQIQARALNVDTLPKPQDRIEYYLDHLCRNVLLSNGDETSKKLPEPQSRIEHYLNYLGRTISENGGLLGGSSGGGTGFVWRPNVDSDGNISWTMNSSSTVPATMNIKGEKGEQGLQGVAGQNGTDGREVQMQVSETNVIQWKYNNEQNWNDLIDLSNVIDTSNYASKTQDNHFEGLNSFNQIFLKRDTLSTYIDPNRDHSMTVGRWSVSSLIGAKTGEEISKLVIGINSSQNIGETISNIKIGSVDESNNRLDEFFIDNFSTVVLDNSVLANGTRPYPLNTDRIVEIPISKTWDKNILFLISVPEALWGDINGSGVGGTAGGGNSLPSVGGTITLNNSSYVCKVAVYSYILESISNDFDNTDTDLKSSTISEAIKEVDSKTDRATTISGQLGIPISSNDFTDKGLGTITVSKEGTITSSLNPSFTSSNASCILFNEGIEEFELVAWKPLYFIVVGSDYANAHITMAIGGQNSVAKITTGGSNTATAINSNYPKTYYSTHTYTLGTTYRIKNKATEVEVYYKNLNDDFVHWFSIVKNNLSGGLSTNNGWGSNRLGIACGISSGESNGTIIGTVKAIIPKCRIGNQTYNSNISSIIKDNNARKLAILSFSGQSNAVGYDESPVRYGWKYNMSPRIKQLGFWGQNNLEIIPLGHCAESFQDMRTQTNPSSPDKVGTKGLHLPLANLILKSIPDNYDIIIVPCAYGGTGFTTNHSVGTYDSTTMKPSSGTLKWGVNSPYYLAMKDRIKFLLDMDEDNIFLGNIWIQGENDANNKAGHKTGFDTMTEDFFNYFNNEGYGDRVKKGTWDKDIWYNIETVPYWYTVGSCREIWDENYKAWNEKTYVQINADNTNDTNLTNGTGGTSSTKQSHYGNNAYYRIVAPAIYQKMLDNDALF